MITFLLCLAVLLFVFAGLLFWACCYVGARADERMGRYE